MLIILQVKRIYIALGLQTTGVSPGRATIFTPLTLPSLSLSRAAGIPFNPSATNSTLLDFNYKTH